MTFTQFLHAFFFSYLFNFHKVRYTVLGYFKLTTYGNLLAKQRGKIFYAPWLIKKLEYLPTPLSDKQVKELAFRTARFLNLFTTHYLILDNLKRKPFEIDGSTIYQYITAPTINSLCLPYLDKVDHRRLEYWCISAIVIILQNCNLNVKAEFIQNKTKNSSNTVLGSLLISSRHYFNSDDAED